MSSMSKIFGKDWDKVWENFNIKFADFNSVFSSRISTERISSDYKIVDGQYVIECEMPGFTKDKTTITTRNGNIYVEAIRSGLGGKTTYESSYSMPENAELDKISAIMADGLLTITVPSDAKQSSASKIEIK